MRYLLPLLFLLACNTPDQPGTNDALTETTTTTAPMMAETPDSLLRHAVLFSFKESAYPAGAKAVEDAFRELPNKIPEIHDFEWGTNNSPEGLDQGYTHLFFVTFKSEEDRAAYLPHPDHLAFVEALKPHLDQVLVLDYWTQR
ncbi:Dabb family protein [Lewinella sp. 4G2]|uniref:Dabb family protein n=1 Tax=Lewinella sp. 4G2 TaxID=1803372 RepID=UPI0007B47E6B|nr:Dabb family protein [Lewinella sp. 4G2]OAV42801.1 stress responsive alpha-beta barrel domain-containing protein [Lewinella sp. 4G2]